MKKAMLLGVLLMPATFAQAGITEMISMEIMKEKGGAFLAGGVVSSALFYLLNKYFNHMTVDRMNDLEQLVVRMREEAEKYEKRIVQLVSQEEVLQKRIETLEKQGEQVAQLKNEKAQLQAEMKKAADQFKKDMAALRKQVLALKKEDTANKGKIAELEKQKADLEVSQAA